MPYDRIDPSPNEAAQYELGVFAKALGLDGTADLASILAAIEGFHVLKEAETLEQVRGRLSFPAYADAMYCTADLCRRLPPIHGTAVVAAMFRIEVKERARAAGVAEIKAAALRSPSAPLNG